MNDDRQFEFAVDDWLAAGSDLTPRPTVDAVLLAIRTTPQQRDLRIPWRIPSVPDPLRLVSAIAVIAAVGVVGLIYLRPATWPGIGAPSATPSPRPTTTASPAATPTPSLTTAPPTRNPRIPVDWREYTSSQSGSTIGYPHDWTIDPATRAWTYESDGDDAGLPTSPAADHFTNPAGDVRVSTWTVPIESSSMPSWGGLRWSFVETWAEEDCAKLTGRLCEGIADRAEPMCLERADCHEAAVLIPGSSEVIAYVLDYDGARMQIVAVWRDELDPEVSPYGGARKLLEAFLVTKNVFPPAPGQMPPS